MSMYLTHKNHLRVDKHTHTILKKLVRLSKNLYNLTRYTVRQQYFTIGTYPSYERECHLVRYDENYRLLRPQVAQQTMKVVDRSMKSFNQGGIRGKLNSKHCTTSEA